MRQTDIDYLHLKITCASYPIFFFFQCTECQQPWKKANTQRHGQPAAQKDNDCVTNSLRQKNAKQTWNTSHVCMLLQIVDAATKLSSTYLASLFYISGLYLIWWKLKNPCHNLLTKLDGIENSLTYSSRWQS